MIPTSALGVLLVGAAGTFGKLLAAQLAAEPGVELILAGRTAATLDRVNAGLARPAALRRLDRDRVSAAEIRRLGAHCVIDAAGPFQDGSTTLVEAAIEAGCHVVDLADARAYVAGIGRFDAAARAAGVVVLSGASSTPALSHAVLDRLTSGWQAIDRILVAISPGNRAPRGLSVVRAILSYVGRPVRVFCDGGWCEVAGWSSTRKLVFPGLGCRLASLCETPDLDLLVTRFAPRRSAEFLAGLELGILHRGLAAAGILVRVGLVPTLAPFAKPFHAIASLFEPFGSDRGGMLVAVEGRDGEGAPAAARWVLRATAGRGPYVPTLPALALVRRLRDGPTIAPGARPCVGILSLDDFAGDFARLGIETERLGPDGACCR